MFLTKYQTLSTFSTFDSVSQEGLHILAFHILALSAARTLVTGTKQEYGRQEYKSLLLKLVVELHDEFDEIKRVGTQ